MMTWNYRIIFHPAEGNDDAWYGLHEVYYDAAGEPEGETENPITFVCDLGGGPEGIQRSLAMALRDALRLPVLIGRDGKLEPYGEPPSYIAQVEAYEEVFREDRDILRELAKR